MILSITALDHDRWDGGALFCCGFCRGCCAICLGGIIPKPQRYRQKFSWSWLRP